MVKLTIKVAGQSTMYTDARLPLFSLSCTLLRHLLSLDKVSARTPCNGPNLAISFKDLYRVISANLTVPKSLL